MQKGWATLLISNFRCLFVKLPSWSGGKMWYPSETYSSSQCMYTCLPLFINCLSSGGNVGAFSVLIYTACLCFTSSFSHIDIVLSLSVFRALTCLYVPYFPPLMATFADNFGIKFPASLWIILFNLSINNLPLLFRPTVTFRSRHIWYICLHFCERFLLFSALG